MKVIGCFIHLLRSINWVSSAFKFEDMFVDSFTVNSIQNVS